MEKEHAELAELAQIEPPVEPADKQADTPTGIFQAIGIITGDVAFIKDEEKNKYIANITIAGNQYNLLPNGFSWGKQASFMGLRKQIEATGISKQRLIVYPKITHYPGKEQQHKMAFQLVGFEKAGASSAIAKDLNDFEFKLSGLWQFIPVCRTPCITVMKNFSDERLEYIKQAELVSKVNFMKASHIPLIWKDAIVPAFRFNPKTPKEEQGKAMFISIKARFIPGKDIFGFDSLLALPQEEPPKHLKAGKKDKAEVLKGKLAARRASKPKVDKPKAESKPVAFSKPIKRSKPD